ncbi:hypothetical protein K438DRAFT_1774270 [Mycena galopus ATCC 62051]|nr:hypothetical protein K438DRAFT_1774270 [Mycena galopus ATCC 62051]
MRIVTVGWGSARSQSYMQRKASVQGSNIRTKGIRGMERDSMYRGIKCATVHEKRERARRCGRAGMTHSLKEGKDRIESRKNTDVHSQEAGSVEETEASDERAQACLERRSSHRGTWRKEMRGETSAHGGTNGGDGRVRGSAARDHANGEAVVSPQHVNGEKINISSQDASDQWCAVPWSVANVGAKAGLRLTEKFRIPDQGQEDAYPVLIESFGNDADGTKRPSREAKQWEPKDGFVNLNLFIKPSMPVFGSRDATRPITCTQVHDPTDFE